MSILIKGMEMPQRCMGCTLCYVGHMGDLMCEALRRPIKVDETGRDRFCPLIEVPPHGRLIDADKFKADHSMKNDCAECEKKLQGSSKSCEYDRIYSKMDFCKWFDDAPTIIEAEE